MDDPHNTPEFHAYLRARDAVLRMKTASAPEAGINPSAYWSEELEHIDYLIEASPLIVRKLRQHAFHITGVRAYDYRNKHDGRMEFFESRLRALLALGGESLLVPESPALGGFGHVVDGRRFNVDTLKFYEVLIGMQRGGVLDAIRQRDHALVCEIGAGWGGFAYHFKTLFPRTTYVIVDFPELFLFSATYLGAVFPEARMHFVGTGASPTIDGWREADFVFVPYTLSRLVSTLPLDLTVNMVSFQEMTQTQVSGYAEMAATAGCPLLYSLNRERSLYNSELISVSEALADWYQLTEVAVLDTDYTNAFRKPPKTVRAIDPAEPRYRHLVGRLDPTRQTTARAAGVTTSGAAPRTAGPRVVLGMTLYNNAQFLPQAMESLLAQRYDDFMVLLLDDASGDGTDLIARGYAERDPRVRYVRHEARQAMIATWREVADTAARDWPSAEYFAWVSDHDWWHPRWLARLVEELDAHPSAVLAYPITRRVSPSGAELQKGARLFDTASMEDLAARWRHFCHEGVGAGDMVYGLVRMKALLGAGVFRPVLRPDRLLMAELTLQGPILQVPEVLWYRRQSSGTSVERQQTSLMLAGSEPEWFGWPPWLQHTVVLWREYVAREPRPLPLSRARWIGMLARYQVTYGWRHFRKTEASHALARGISRAELTKKLVKHHYHHAVYDTLMWSKAARGRLRRLGRRVVYEALMLTHRLGLRGRKETP